MEQIMLSLVSGILGAIIGSYITIKINRDNRKVAAVERLLSTCCPSYIRLGSRVGGNQTKGSQH